jgi:hypothetical protein
MRLRLKLTMLVMVVGLVWATGAMAQQVNPPPSQFGITGFIQEATLNPRVGTTIPSDPQLYGGTLTVNGIKMIVPNNTVVQMPAASFTWAQLFNPATSASVGYTPPRPNHRPGITGLALADNLVNPLQGTRAGAGLVSAPGAGPYPAYEVSVNGNVVTDPVTGAQRYIVGLITPIEQQVLNGTGGLINYIDYATGRFRVGGIPGNPTTGTLCEINDPVGRWGKAHSPDPRFTSDTSWPTISTATAYPVGIPRVAPPAIDPDCPIYNRPLNNGTFADLDPFLAVGAPLRTFTMPFKAQPNAPGDTTPDPWKMVPLMVGDWVDFAGTVFKINPLGPNTAANTFVSIHTLDAHLTVKTTPGTNPAYVRVEGFMFGVGDRNGGPTVSAGSPLTPIAQETSTRVVLVSFTSNSDPTLLKGDPSLVRGSLFGVDVDPVSGVETEWPFPNGNPGNPDFAINDPIRGRLQWATSDNGNTPGFLANATGPRQFYREYILRLSSGQTQLPDQVALQPNGQPLPGLYVGEYRLPIFDYLFGEGTTFGQPIPPNNYNNLGFLNVGCGPLGGFGSGGPVIGRLDPWPGGAP